MRGVFDDDLPLEPVRAATPSSPTSRPSDRPTSVLAAIGVAIVVAIIALVAWQRGGSSGDDADAITLSTVNTTTSVVGDRAATGEANQVPSSRPSPSSTAATRVSATSTTATATASASTTQRSTTAATTSVRPTSTTRQATTAPTKSTPSTSTPSTNPPPTSPPSTSPTSTSTVVTGPPTTRPIVTTVAPGSKEVQVTNTVLQLMNNQLCRQPSSTPPPGGALEFASAAETRYCTAETVNVGVARFDSDQALKEFAASAQQSVANLGIDPAGVNVIVRNSNVIVTAVSPVGDDAAMRDWVERAQKVLNGEVVALANL